MPKTPVSLVTVMPTILARPGVVDNRPFARDRQLALLLGRSLRRPRRSRFRQICHQCSPSFRRHFSFRCGLFHGYLPGCLFPTLGVENRPPLLLAVGNPLFRRRRHFASFVWSTFHNGSGRPAWALAELTANLCDCGLQFLKLDLISNERRIQK